MKRELNLGNQIYSIEGLYMRFNQLKHDPNSIMRKKLVKSKKNWIVVASLSLAGGIFLMGTPSLNVKADTMPTQINSAKSSTATKSPTDSLTTAKNNTTTQSTTVDNNQASTGATNESKSTTDVAESPTTSVSTSTNNETKTNPANTVENNLAKSKTQLESLGVTPSEFSADTNTDTTNTNIAQGVQGTTPWFISADGSLHLGDSTQTTALSDNTTTTTDKVSGSSSAETATTPTTTTAVTPSDTSSTGTNSNTNAASTTTNTAPSTGTSNTTQKQSSTNSDTAQNSNPDNSNSTTSTINTATTTSVATSPWQKYANNINNITFDGKVTGADDMNHMFSDLSNLTTINNINQLDTSNTENVSGLFANDTKLTTVTGSKTTDGVVDLSDLNLTSVTDTSDMFLDDSSIQDITFPERATTIKKSTNFNYMFKNDISLNALDVSNWQFSYAKTMLGMFQNDKSLKNLSISSWNMDTDPDTGDSSKNEGMFDGTDLQSIKLSSANTFKIYTALPSSKSNGWTNGSVAFSAEPNAGNNYTYNLNSIKGQLSLRATTFTPNSASDPTVPTYTVTLTVPTSLGNQTFTHTGTLNSSFSVTPNTYPGYTPDISTIVATITSTTQATTNYYINYVGNLVGQWSVNGVNSPTGQTMTVTGTTSSTGDPARIGDTFYINPDTTNTGYTVSKVGSGLISTDDNGNPTYSLLTQPEYVGINIPESSAQFSTTTGVTKNVTIPKGQYGNTSTTIIVPNIPGYTLSADSPKTLNVVYNKNGTSSVDTSKVTYIPNTVPTWTANNVKGPDNTTVSASGTTNSDDTTAKIGDTVSINPDVSGTGYYVEKPGVGVIKANTTTGAPEVDITTQPTYKPITINASSVTFKTKTSSATVTIPAGQYGNTTTTIKTPDIPGYTLSTDSPKTLQVTYNKNGTSSVDTSSVTYVPNTVSSWTASDIKGPDDTTVSASGTTNSDNATAKIGDTVSINPDVNGTGYQVATPGTGTIIIDSKTGEPTIRIDNQPTYEPITIPKSSITFTTPTGVTKAVEIPEGQYGNTATMITVPDIPGYTLSADSPKNLQVTYNKNGTSSVDTSKVTYIPNTVTSWTVDNVKGPENITVSASGTTNIDNTTAKIGDTVSINPDVTGTGYQVDKPGTGTIVANSITGQPEIKITTNPSYIPIPVPSSTQTITTKDGTKIQVTIPSGDVTVKNQTINVPKIPGYTASESTLPVSYNKDGSVTVDSSNLTYTPNNVPNWSTTVTDPTGKTIQVSGTNAKVGQTVTLSPNIPGYDTTSGTAVIKANSDGSTFLDITKAPTYAPTKVPTWSTNVNGPTAGSQIKINGTDVHYGQTITLNPNTDNLGYTVSQPGKGIVAVDKDGNFYISVTQQPSYTADSVKNWQTTITLPNHQTMQVSGNTNSDNQSAKFGDTVTINPEVPGYQVTPGTGIIVADKNGQPTIQIITEPKFTKIPSTTTTQPMIQKIHTNISTHPNSGNIPIYQWNYDNMSILKNQQLAPQTDWFTDQTIVVSGIKYYRIATNEWVKASQVYPYRDLDIHIRTYDKTTKVLYESADQIVGNREIQPNSSWYSNQTAYFINGEKYYRIADGEFVKASDAYVYQPTDMTVRVKNDTPIQNLYTAKGQLITNRSLVADSDWFVDSIVYINGIKYYRVATDEFVKASDVGIDY